MIMMITMIITFYQNNLYRQYQFHKADNCSCGVSLEIYVFQDEPFGLEESSPVTVKPIYKQNMLANNKDLIIADISQSDLFIH